LGVPRKVGSDFAATKSLKNVERKLDILGSNALQPTRSTTTNRHARATKTTAKRARTTVSHEMRAIGKLFPIWKLRCVHVTTRAVMRRERDQVTWRADVSLSEAALFRESNVVDSAVHDLTMFSTLNG
jgi:hypothetical protein